MSDNMRITLAKDMAEQFDPETMEWDNGIGRRTVWVSHPLQDAVGDPEKPIVVRDKPKPVSLAEFLHAYDLRFANLLSALLIEAGYATEYPRSES